MNRVGSHGFHLTTWNFFYFFFKFLKPSSVKESLNMNWNLKIFINFLTKIMTKAANICFSYYWVTNCLNFHRKCSLQSWMKPITYSTIHNLSLISSQDILNYDNACISLNVSYKIQFQPTRWIHLHICVVIIKLIWRV